MGVLQQVSTATTFVIFYFLTVNQPVSVAQDTAARCTIFDMISCWMPCFPCRYRPGVTCRQVRTGCGCEMAYFDNNVSVQCTPELAARPSPRLFTTTTTQGTPVQPAEASECAVGVRRVQCLVDPCDVTSCPSAPAAVCRSSYCGGCFADFYQDGLRVNCQQVPLDMVTNLVGDNAVPFANTVPLSNSVGNLAGRTSTTTLGPALETVVIIGSQTNNGDSGTGSFLPPSNPQPTLPQRTQPAGSNAPVVSSNPPSDTVAPPRNRFFPGAGARSVLDLNLGGSGSALQLPERSEVNPPQPLTSSAVPRSQAPFDSSVPVVGSENVAQRGASGASAQISVGNNGQQAQPAVDPRPPNRFFPGLAPRQLATGSVASPSNSGPASQQQTVNVEPRPGNSGTVNSTGGSIVEPIPVNRVFPGVATTQVSGSSSAGQPQVVTSQPASPNNQNTQPPSSNNQPQNVSVQPISPNNQAPNVNTVPVSPSLQSSQPAPTDSQLQNAASQPSPAGTTVSTSSAATCSPVARQVTCRVDPCRGQTCSVTGAQCRPSSCGSCHAEWFVGDRLVQCREDCAASRLANAWCPMNPCGIQTCDAFPSAVCRVSTCGSCRAEWYADQREVTDECFSSSSVDACPGNEPLTCTCQRCPSSPSAICKIRGCGSSCRLEFTIQQNGQERVVPCHGLWHRF